MDLINNLRKKWICIFYSIHLIVYIHLTVYIHVILNWYISDLSSSLNNSQEYDVLAAGENCGEYLQLAKKGGGHKGKH